jgi:ribosome biogenesis protein UTP30
MQKKLTEKKIQKHKKSVSSFLAQKLDQQQVLKAVKALQKFSKAKREGISKNLLEDEADMIHVSFTLTKVATKPSPKPLLIAIPHPFHSEKNGTRVCLFVKDPARELKDKLDGSGVPCIAKVIGYDKLKRNFKQFKDRRALLKEYDAFIADLRIYKMLPEVLGREFY